MEDLTQLSHDELLREYARALRHQEAARPQKDGPAGGKGSAHRADPPDPGRLEEVEAELRRRIGA
jgi:hypothetical protein